MKKSAVLLAAASLAPLLLGACGSGSGARDDRTRVVASFYALAFVAERVGGTAVDVDSLTAPGVEPHDLELAPKQVARVQDADLVVYQSEFQNAVDAAIEQADRDEGTTLDVAAEIDPLPADEHDEHDGHDGHDHDDHDHGDLDPHTWLNPAYMVVFAKAVTERLSAVAPEHADRFAANADTLIDELTDLDAAFTAGLATCRNRTIVTSHAAFGHLADRYDLDQVPIAGLDPTNEPTPADLAAITDLVRSRGVTTVFTEELVSPAIARTIAKETGVGTATLDPIEGLSERTKDQDYLSLMRANLDTLRKANDCA